VPVEDNKRWKQPEGGRVRLAVGCSAWLGLQSLRSSFWNALSRGFFPPATSAKVNRSSAIRRRSRKSVTRECTNRPRRAMVDKARNMVRPVLYNSAGFGCWLATQRFIGGVHTASKLPTAATANAPMACSAPFAISFHALFI